MAVKLKTTREQRVRHVLRRFRYRSQHPARMGQERGLMDHHIEALVPVIKQMIAREVHYAKQGGRHD